MILNDYLNFLNEQRMGNQPVNPVQKPQPARGSNQVKSKVPGQPQAPVNPQEKASPKGYFNYMVWTTKVLKQGEIFRRVCYQNNCQQFAGGSGDRRVCKDRCDIETCKKVIGMLRISMGKCAQAKEPDKCKQRYSTLIPVYQKKLNTISNRFATAKKKDEVVNPKVG